MVAELTESQINGRFRVLERPSVAPGKCGVCGAVDKPVIDFGFDLDYYGVVYFCIECICEAASLLGMVPNNELVTAQLVQQDLADRLETSGELINEYVNRINDLHDEFTRRLSGESIPSSEEPAEVSADVSGNAPTEPGPVDTDSEQKPRTSRKQRSISVPSDSSDGSTAIDGPVEGVFSF